jgi:membrane fusion protein, multidrug efflux system
LKFFYLFFGIVLLSAISCKDEPKQATGMGGPGGNPGGGPPPVFSGVIAEAYPINRNIEAPGTILANETTNMQPEISGRVVSINFKEGTNVKAGTLLVKLFDGDLQAQLKKLAVQLTIAEATEKRQKELLAINGTSQQDYDNASLNVNNIKADMELLKVRIAQTEVRAPFNGRLGLRNISLGAYINPTTIITNISQMDVIKVEFSVPEKYAHEMLPNKILTLRTVDQSKVYYATVIASQNNISAETRNLLVRAVVKDPDNRITPGTFVEVSIGLGYNANAIMVPTQAVIPSTRNKKLIVMRNGKAVLQDVTTGFRDASRVEITEGIALGDTIITSGLLSIKDGMACKVVLEKK